VRTERRIDGAGCIEPVRRGVGLAHRSGFVFGGPVFGARVFGAFVLAPVRLTDDGV
jgi:hypothetical protein